MVGCYKFVGLYAASTWSPDVYMNSVSSISGIKKPAEAGSLFELKRLKSQQFESQLLQYAYLHQQRFGSSQFR